MTPLDYDEAAKPVRRWKPAVAALAVAAALAGGVGLLVTSDPTRTVSGTPVTSVTEVVKYTDEVKAQELAAQVEAEAVYLSDLQEQVRKSIQEYFDDPANDLTFLSVTVHKVGLIKTADSKYEGMATLQAAGYTARKIAVHVTADGHTFMWQSDPGALRSLIR